MLRKRNDSTLRASLADFENGRPKIPKMIRKLIDKLGVTGIIVILLIIVIYTFLIVKKNARVSDATYVSGASLGLTEGVKGNINLEYEFIVDGRKYKGFVPGSFCDECKNCCSIGDTVIVRYQAGNPENNDLILKPPKNIQN